MDYLIHIFFNAGRTRCCNCKREDHPDSNSVYRLNISPVSSNQFKRKSCFRFLSRSSKSQGNRFLCEQCHASVVEGSKEFENTWPAFIWKLLSSQCRSAFYGSEHYNQVYTGEELWKIIPLTMRPLWLNSVRSICHSGPFYPFSNCTLEYPSPFFVDITPEYNKHMSNLEQGTFGGVKSAVSQESTFLPNVLCPFGCTDYCFEAKECHWDMVIQQYLIKTPIATVHDQAEQRRYLSVWTQYFREADDYDEIGLNSKWKIHPTILLTDSGPVVLTCRRHGNLDDNNRLYPPRPPSGCELSAEQNDQLSHITVNSHVARPTRLTQYGATYAMTNMHGNYSGLGTCRMSQHSSWEKPSYLLGLHEDLSLAGRHDIRLLLSQKVEKQQLPPEFAERMLKESERNFPPGSLDRFIHGSTYVPTEDLYKIHIQNSLEEANDSYKITVVNKNDSTISCRRSWPRLINILQKEDMDDFGINFRAIPTIADKGEGGHGKLAGMMSWALCSILSSVKELWEIVDSRQTWRHDQWEGYWIFNVDY